MRVNVIGFYNAVMVDEKREEGREQKQTQHLHAVEHQFIVLFSKW